MKKEQRDRNDNVIAFPGLVNRLYEKGIAFMEAHDFDQASSLLRQVHEMKPDDAKICASYLVSLYEARLYDEAKELAEEMLHEGLGDYYDVIDIYLMVLIQMGEHKQVVHTLDALFEEREVPLEKAEHFHTLLQLSKKVVANGDKKDVKTAPFSNDVLSSQQDLPEQALILGSLMEKNIHPYLDQLLRLLADADSHPFLQTMALNVLKENKLDHSVAVNKIGHRGEFVPRELPSVDAMPLLLSIKMKLATVLENDNPILLGQLEEMLGRHFFVLYPYELTPANPDVWAGAYLGIGYDMYGEEWNQEQMAQRFGVSLRDLTEAVGQIYKLEQISSPIV